MGKITQHIFGAWVWGQLLKLDDNTPMQPPVHCVLQMDADQAVAHVIVFAQWMTPQFLSLIPDTPNGTAFLAFIVNDTSAFHATKKQAMVHHDSKTDTYTIDGVVMYGEGYEGGIPTHYILEESESENE